MKRCTKCFRFISRTFEVCPYCGSNSLIDIDFLYRIKNIPLEEIFLKNRRYLIEGVVAKGGFAYILKVKEPRNQSVYALKLPISAASLIEFASFIDDTLVEKSEEMLRKEIKILTSYSHPGIVGIVDYGEFHMRVRGEERTFPYYIMELAYGDVEALMQKYGKDNFPVEEKIKIIKQVAKTLSYLHAMNTVYRDLSLKNILIMDRGEQNIYYVLSDFGTAKSATGTTTTFGKTSLVGTSRYLDPVYFRDMLKYRKDPRIDIYSLGVLTFEIWLGTWNWQNYMDIVSINPLTINFPDIVSQAERKYGLPQPIARVIKKATSLNIDERYKNAEEFLNNFRNALSEMQIDAKTTDTSPMLIEQQAKQEQEKIKYEVVFRIKIPLPLPQTDSTYVAPMIEYEEGKIVNIPGPFGGIITLPQAVIIEKVRKISGPSFVEAVQTHANLVNIRVTPSKLKEVLNPILSLSQRIKGHLVFEGKLEVVGHES